MSEPTDEPDALGEHDGQHGDEPEHTYEEVVEAPPGRPLYRDAPFYRGFFWTLGALAAVLFVLAVRAAAAMLILVLIAAFLAVALEPVVGFVGRRGVHRRWAVLVIAVGIVVVLGTIVYVLGTTLRDQVSSLIDNAPNLVDELRKNRTVRNIDDRFHILSTIEQEATDPDNIRSVVGGAFGFGLGVVNFAINAVVVYVLMVYFLAARPQVTRAMYALAPESRRERVAALGDEILHRVGRYAIGAVVVALIAGTVTAVFCVSAGLGEYALPLALGVALLDLVPLVGSISGAAIVCVVCFADSAAVGLAALIFYVIYETLEGYVIYPRVMRSSVDVPEYVTIVAVLIGGAVAGIVGALIALPMAAAILLIGREVWVRRQETT